MNSTKMKNMKKTNNIKNKSSKYNKKKKRTIGDWLCLFLCCIPFD